MGAFGNVADVFDFLGFKLTKKFLVWLVKEIFSAAADPQQLKFFVYRFRLGQQLAEILAGTAKERTD